MQIIEYQNERQLNWVFLSNLLNLVNLLPNLSNFLQDLAIQQLWQWISLFWECKVPPTSSCFTSYLCKLFIALWASSPLTRQKWVAIARAIQQITETHVLSLSSWVNKLYNGAPCILISWKTDKRVLRLLTGKVLWD